jgi:transposase
MNPEENRFPKCTHWLGLDVAKATFDAALVRAGQKYPATPLASLPVRRFARTSEGVRELLQWLEPLVAPTAPAPEVRAVMEATGRYSTELAQWLLDAPQKLIPAIAPPQMTAAFLTSMGLRNKTDKLEARALAFYGAERQPWPFIPMTGVQAELRELNRCRDFLVHQRVAMGNRAAEVAGCNPVRHMHDKRLRLLDADIERIEDEMRQRIAADPDIARDIELMSTIYGVGFLTAATIRAELGDLRRFRQARELSAYVGLNPAQRESGARLKGRSRMGKKGNFRVRQALYLAAMVVVRGDNDLQRTYRQLQKQGKSAMAALGAVMRKLLVLMRAILISGKPFDRRWKTHPQRTSTC